MFTVTDIPGKGSFTVLPGKRVDTYMLRIVFADRARLEVQLTAEKAIDLDQPFKYMNHLGMIHELPWSSTAKEVVAPEVDVYLEEAIWFVQGLTDQIVTDEISFADDRAAEEIMRIRAMMAIHTRKVNI